MSYKPRNLRGLALLVAGLFGVGSGVAAKAAAQLPADTTQKRIPRRKDDRPGHVSTWFKERAHAKRVRRAANPHASAYARANVR